MVRLRTVAFAAMAIAGCGSTSSHSSTVSQLGTAAGQGFVRAFSPVKYKSAGALAADFSLWVSGKGWSSAPGAPPGSALTPAQRHAAAAVVLAYALRLVSEDQLPATLPDGQSVTAYLRSHGVQ